MTVNSVYLWVCDKCGVYSASPDSDCMECGRKMKQRRFMTADKMPDEANTLPLRIRQLALMYFVKGDSPLRLEDISLDMAIDIIKDASAGFIRTRESNKALRSEILALKGRK